MDREDWKWLAKFLFAVGMALMVESFAIVCLMDALNN